ncbi:SRPBCC family protein [Actinomadura sp. 6N118]|uniref:SRPBCC family protein n=1 Tax=Actinomadura sp. 6N118 TaxID=3375151 RepID=UPI0037A9E50D
MSFQISLDIHRPPSQVFAFIADFRTMPQWYEAVDRVEAMTATSPGKGARFHMVRSLPGGPAHNDVEIIAYVPDEEIAFSSTSGPTPFRYHYRIEPITGGSRLTLDGEISGDGLPGPAARLGGLAARLFKQGMKKNLDTLKQILESPAQPQSTDGYRE